MEYVYHEGQEAVSGEEAMRLCPVLGNMAAEHAEAMLELIALSQEMAVESLPAEQVEAATKPVIERAETVQKTVPSEDSELLHQVMVTEAWLQADAAQDKEYQEAAAMSTTEQAVGSTEEAIEHKNHSDAEPVATEETIAIAPRKTSVKQAPLRHEELTVNVPRSVRAVQEQLPNMPEMTEARSFIVPEAEFAIEPMPLAVLAGEPEDVETLVTPVEIAETEETEEIVEFPSEVENVFVEEMTEDGAEAPQLVSSAEAVPEVPQLIETLEAATTLFVEEADPEVARTAAELLEIITEAIAELTDLVSEEASDLSKLAAVEAKFTEAYEALTGLIEVELPKTASTVIESLKTRTEAVLEESAEDMPSDSGTHERKFGLFTTAKQSASDLAAAYEHGWLGQFILRLSQAA